MKFKICLFIFSLSVFFPLFSSSVFSFSFEIKSVSPDSVSSKTQEVQVLLDIVDLPSESFFRVAWQEGEGGAYFGYVKDSSGNWAEIKPLSSEECSNYYKVSQIGDSQITLVTKIGEEEEISSGTYLLRAHRFTSTCGSSKASGNSFEVSVNLSSFSPTEAPTAASTPTSTPPPASPENPTNTPIPAPAKGIYQINEVKNKDGDILSSVKIYVDGGYVHHYAQETLEFCDGCYCYNEGDEQVSCGFGEHAIRLEKSSYEDWSETKTINAGDDFEVDPVMSESSTSSPDPTSTPTPKPTATPKAKTPTKKPTKKPTPKKSPTPKLSPEVLGEEATKSGLFLLGESTASAIPEMIMEGPKGQRDFIPFLFIGSGVLLIGAALVPFLPREKAAKIKEKVGDIISRAWFRFAQISRAWFAFGRIRKTRRVKISKPVGLKK